MSLFSLVQPTLDALGGYPQTIQISHIDSLLGHYYPNLSVDRPALIGPLTDESQCEQLCDLIRLAYPADHTVKIVSQLPSIVPLPVRTLSLKELATVSLDQGPSLLYPKVKIADNLMTTEFRRAGHRARLNARCCEVGTVTAPTVFKA